MTGLAGLLLLAAPEPLVDVSARIPDAVVDLRYATADNFMKKQVYPTGASCLLLERSAELLARAAEALRAKGYRLRLYDCYRPHAVQYLLWAAMPKRGYVAEPKTGSNHNRGGAVDLSLVTLDGREVEMPSGYDAFGPAAHHGFSGGTAASRANREVLRAAMKAVGFVSNRMEWWHYDLPDAAKYPLREEPFVVDGGAALNPARESPR
jgi:D-alanyl-D-alanine dipeptidase